MVVFSSIQMPLAMVQEFLENMQQELLIPIIFMLFYLVLMKKTAGKLFYFLFQVLSEPFESPYVFNKQLHLLFFQFVFNFEYNTFSK